MSRRAGIYARISDDREGRGLGVKRQEQDCRELCAQRGWTVERVYTDNDISASKRRKRPGYDEMMADVKDGVIDAIVAWHNDRLHRRAVELEGFIAAVEAARVEVATVNGGRYDLTTATGRMQARVVGAVATYESELKSERARRKARELAEAGSGRGGGTRPYGYEADRVTVCWPEAAVVRDLAARLVAGESLRSLTADLNRRRVPTVTGAAWTMHVVRRLLMSSRIVGRRTHHGAVVADAEWPAIVHPAVWNRCHALLADPGRRRLGTARRYLLRGLARCGLCEAKLVARPKADKRRCYVCASGPELRGCGKIRVLSEPLEALVESALFDAIDSGRVTASAPGDVSVDAALAYVAELEDRLRELSDDFHVHRRVSRDQFASSAGKLEAMLADARADAGQVTRRTVLDGDVRDRYDTGGFDVRRAVLFAVVDAVVVRPAVKGRNRFDPGRIEIRWAV